MGPAFVIVIWGILAVAFGIVWLCLLAGFLIGILRKKKWLKWAAGLPLIFMTLLPCVLVGVVGYGLIQSTRPSIVFKQAFDQKPPAGITNLQSKYWFFADSGSIYLRFNCSPETFESIRPSGLERTSREDFKDTFGNRSYSGDAPSWWSPEKIVGEGRYYVGRDSKGKNKHFSSETEILVYDVSSGVAFYNYLGID